ncbi:efflux RND transporter periplasmic adaptor subunit [Vibrio sp. SCSIO 43137]|uniref:efflux RND transporter periplasmic adaptor subunit n=1 Tax=Vibrio sp. SCSIO 43137 TaxID=3021011 RepID=UPI00230811BD|nr:efflux RND transporter periplasmic adaptor subunit [Vibrio sp. SCSIO 43137]WCE31568.1 efflux RND transporter periplasmic adaptor subunit [Vibrio sp. SCSIO 43137]
MKKHLITIAVTAVSAASIFAAAAFNGSQIEAQKEQESRIQAEQKTNAPAVTLQQVEVIEVTAGSYRAHVTGYGEARSRFELTFSSEVNGRVNSVNSQFESGQVVKKGTVLASIDTAPYEQALAEAESNLAQAKLALLEEERQGTQAKSEWEKSGIKGEPASALVLREPQLIKAKKALENAQKAQIKAKEDLSHTQIRAPFDALIVSRDIAPGSYLQTGGTVATLYSVEEMEIKIPLSQSQWGNLPNLDNEQLAENPNQWPVSLTSSDGQSGWTGYIRRVEQHLNSSTRQRSLWVVVDKPLEQSTDLYPGSFVRADISGSEKNSLWKLPASAISQQGEIWMVDNAGLLHSYPVQTQFSSGDYVYISPLSSEKSLVVKRPLNSYKANMLVAAKTEGQS